MRPFSRRGIISKCQVLFGENPGATSVFSGHAHNNLLDLLGGTGLLGAIAWIAWCVRCLSWRGRPI